MSLKISPSKVSHSAAILYSVNKDRKLLAVSIFLDCINPPSKEPDISASPGDSLIRVRVRIKVRDKVMVTRSGLRLELKLGLDHFALTLSLSRRSLD
jgi:hypothetical protein